MFLTSRPAAGRPTLGKTVVAGRFGFGDDEARVSTGRFAWNMIACMGAVV